MKNNDNSYISPWGYVGYSVLWTLPVLGWIIWIFACFSKRENKRNYARSFILALIVSIVICLYLTSGIFVGVLIAVADYHTQESINAAQSTMMLLM